MWCHLVVLLLLGHADAEARRSVLTALPCVTLVTATWQAARVMAFLDQRAGRWSLRGSSSKLRQVKCRV